MRQASRQWYAMLKKCLLALGFEQCLADSCVFSFDLRGYSSFDSTSACG